MNTETAAVAAPKFTVTQVAYTYTVRNAAGELVAIGTFAPPPYPGSYEACRAVMRERAEFLRRFV